MHRLALRAVAVLLALWPLTAAAQTRVDIHPGKVEIKSTASDALKTAGGVEIATGKTVVAGANTLISSDKLQAGQLSGTITSATQDFITRLGTIASGNFANTAFKVLDTDASHTLAVVPGSNLSANRTFTVTTGDADRTLTLSGSPTLGDWFDQSVKVAATPTFAGVKFTTDVRAYRSAATTLTLDDGAGGNIAQIVTGNHYATGLLGIHSVAYFQSGGGSGIVKLVNWAGTGFSRLILGPSTSSGAALGVSGGTTLNAVLGDDSDWTTFAAKVLQSRSYVVVGTANYATSGAVRLPNNEYVRWRNAANNDNYGLYLNSSDQIQAEVRMKVPDVIVSGAAAASLPAAGASVNGLVSIDTTNNRLVFYVGGSRYYLTGTSF